MTCVRATKGDWLPIESDGRGVCERVRLLTNPKAAVTEEVPLNEPLVGNMAQGPHVR